MGGSSGGWGTFAASESMSAAGTRAARSPPPAATTSASSLERRTLLVDTLTVLKFPEADGADRMIHKLEDLQKQELIQIVDAAIVSWPQGKSKPRTRQLNNLAGFGALDGAFWGLLFGLIFFVPIFGMAIGALMGGMSGALADIGIDDDFVKEVRENVTEGTSALFCCRGVRLSTGLPKRSRGWISRSSKPTCPRSKKRSCARPSLCRGDYGQGRLTSKQGGWGREQLCLEAAQKEGLDAQPNEEEGAAGGRERGGGERAARERGQKGHPRGFGQEFVSIVGNPALRLEEET